jgi:DNA topoisomerase 2-associated protein PAT1
MSFFGFDSNLPRDRGHQANAPGFGQHDAFAGLSSGGAGDDDVYVAPRLARRPSYLQKM